MSNFILIIEGQDKTGKDTLVKACTRKYFERNPLVLHCMSPSSSTENPEEISKKYYFNLLNFVSLESPDQSFILNRSHIGEMVYSPLYRGYSGEYVLTLESHFLSSDITSKKVILVTLIDSSHSRLSREDEDALSVSEYTSKKELKLFTEAAEKSSIQNKLLIDISSMTIEMVHKKVFDFLEKLIET